MADRVVVKHESLALVHKGTKASPPEIVVTGAAFKRIEERVKEVVGMLGDKAEWWDVGPDASYVTAEIYYQNKRYVLHSWYPLYRDTATIGVSETAGLVVVTGSKEKERIESANSKKY